MARIRTIKPDFFTSEDIVALSPMARLLYIGLWCEADREGRLAWRPNTFKLRYFPGDKVDINVLCGELTRRGLVVLYREGLAFIPTFLSHQHINPREAQSTYPPPDPSARVIDASARVDDAQVGRERKERKGKEGVEAPLRSRGSRLPSDWQPSDALKAWATGERPDLEVGATVARFRDYWASIPGSKGVKLDWDATFRNWVRAERFGQRSTAPIDYDALARRLEEQEKTNASL